MVEEFLRYLNESNQFTLNIFDLIELFWNWYGTWL